MTNKLPVPIVVLPSLSVLESKKVLHPEAIPMSPSAARHAVQQESKACLEIAVSVAAVPETAVMDQLRGRCSR